MQPVALPPSTTNESDNLARAHSTATERRMRALPRLLSNDAYSFPSTSANQTHPAVREEAGESDSETEADTSESHDDEEGDSDTGDSTEGGHAAAEEETATRTIRDAHLRVTPGNTPRQMSPASPSMRTSMPRDWVTFAPVTPTPGVPRSARPTTTESGQASDSYFDIRRPASGVSTSRTPGQPLMTPLIPQSYSNSARGRRPMHQDEVVSSLPTPRSPVRASAETDNIKNKGIGSSHYRQRSQSAIALTSPGLREDGPSLSSTASQTLDPIWQNVEGPATPGPSFLIKPPPTPAGAPTPTSPSTQQQAQQSTSPPTPGQNGHRLERRRSMYELPTTPPAYHAVYSRSGTKQVVYPREEEGQEPLPDYTCAIHFEGYLPRKMEFTSPGVQAKDRSWRRAYMILHGTSIKFYKYDLKSHPIPGEEDFSNLSIEMSGRSNNDPPPLHFHPGDYMAAEDQSTSSHNASHHKFPVSIGDAKAKARSKIVQATSSSDNNVLIRHYSLQNAESGLAADYIKRKHVVRVRAEGEQFLLQTNGDRGTIDLIEVLQAATNVALDLDCRPLPKFITLPRRRRRRRRVDPNAPSSGANGASGAATGGSGTAAAQAGAGAGAGGAAERHEEDRMGDMLAEEQQAYAASGAGASTV